MQQVRRTLVVFARCSSPLLIPMQATGEICEQAVNLDLVNPVIVLNIRVLVEIKV